MRTGNHWRGRSPLIDPAARRLAARHVNWWRIGALLLVAASWGLVIAVTLLLRRLG